MHHFLWYIIVFCITNGYGEENIAKVAEKDMSDKDLKYFYPANKHNLKKESNNSSEIESEKNLAVLIKHIYYPNTDNDFTSKNERKNIKMMGYYDKNRYYDRAVIRKRRKAVENNNYNKSELTQIFYENITDSRNELVVNDVNLNLNWQKFININKLGYQLSLGIDNKEEGKWTIVGDSKPEYVLNRLKPNSTYIVNIMPVSCKLQIQFDVNTPRLISDEEAISMINMIHREEKNLTNIRSVAITFKNSFINLTNYVLEVELLTRYNEGSKTVVVQTVNLIPGIMLFTVNNLKPCSIYKFNIRKDNHEMLKLSRAIDSFHSFYMFTGNTDNFKSNIPLSSQNTRSIHSMHNAFEKYTHLKTTGIMPRRRVTCYVENESPFPGFACRDSDICIPMNWVCDGEEDCQDGDDELNCRGFSPTDHYQHERDDCRKNEFRCYSRGDYSCLPVSWLCDGRRDCDDGWDENTLNCRKTFNRPGSTLYNTNAVTCDRDYFRCFNGLGCVAPGFVCDGDQDCSDGSDEWRCKTNGRCNSRYEFQCFYDDAPYNTYSLYRNRHCIPKSWVCDDQDDCPDGEDESFETCNLVRRLGTTSGLFSVIKKIVDPVNYL